jgi:hypothetical protein
MCKTCFPEGPHVEYYWNALSYVKDDNAESISDDK